MRTTLAAEGMNFESSTSFNDLTDKTSCMKSDKKVEVILFSKYSFTDSRQKELVRWVGTTLQSAIAQQEEMINKLFLTKLRNTPKIYLS